MARRVLAAQGALENVDRRGAPAAVEPLEAHGDGAGACTAANDDDRLDDAVAGFADGGRSNRESRPGRGAAGRLARPRRDDDAFEQVAVDVVAHPAGDLLDVAGPGKSLSGGCVRLTNSID